MGNRNKRYKGPKYYAVAVGVERGVYTSWHLCSQQVLGYPGNVYRAFKDAHDAIDFMMRGKKAYLESRQYEQYEGPRSMAAKAARAQARQ